MSDTVVDREWVVLWPVDNHGASKVEGFADEAEARRVASMWRHQGAECAYREVTRGPWTVVPNGDPR